MIKTIEIDLEYQPTIKGPPVSPKQLHNQACTSDEITVNVWRDIWINQTRENHKRFGPFKDKGVGKLFGTLRNSPAIVVGSGPSLKKNVDQLKDTHGIPVISCLHNYHFFEDRGITPDYYVTLDAGPVTIEEVGEGGSKTLNEYFESTKNKKLIAFIGSNPELISRWKGEVYWYTAPIPDETITKAMFEIEPFHTYVSTGGNVLGGCFYIAKAIMAANPIIFVGADFSFSYTKQFHGWNSKYDNGMGLVMRATDVYGNRVWTWGSYNNFKCWFESRVCSVPGLYINSTEGGIFGSYPEGNIEQIKQMDLSDVIKMYSISDAVKQQCLTPEINDKTILF